jgi:hypothetical protein
LPLTEFLFYLYLFSIKSGSDEKQTFNEQQPQQQRRFDNNETSRSYSKLDVANEPAVVGVDLLKLVTTRALNSSSKKTVNFDLDTSSSSSRRRSSQTSVDNLAEIKSKLKLNLPTNVMNGGGVTMSEKSSSSSEMNKNFEDLTNRIERMCQPIGYGATRRHHVDVVSSGLTSMPTSTSNLGVVVQQLPTSSLLSSSVSANHLNQTHSKFNSSSCINLENFLRARDLSTNENVGYFGGKTQQQQETGDEDDERNLYKVAKFEKEIARDAAIRTTWSRTMEMNKSPHPTPSANVLANSSLLHNSKSDVDLNKENPFRIVITDTSLTDMLVNNSNASIDSAANTATTRAKAELTTKLKVNNTLDRKKQLCKKKLFISPMFADI